MKPTPPRIGDSKQKRKSFLSRRAARRGQAHAQQALPPDPKRSGKHRLRAQTRNPGTGKSALKRINAISLHLLPGGPTLQVARVQQQFAPSRQGPPGPLYPLGAPTGAPGAPAA
ncbi:hypothetical protein ETH_00001630, partial [Eimeria tenella]